MWLRSRHKSFGYTAYCLTWICAFSMRHHTLSLGRAASSCRPIEWDTVDVLFQCWWKVSRDGGYSAQQYTHATTGSTAPAGGPVGRNRRERHESTISQTVD